MPCLARRSAQGFALAVALIVIALVAVVTFTAVNVATLDLAASRQDLEAARAAYGARAGLSHARAKLEFDYSYTGSGSGTPQAAEAQLEEQTGFSTRVEPATWNPTTELKVWKITSTGFHQGAQREMIAYAGLESFARYAYFTDRDISSTGTQIWFTSFDEITGPAHTNGFFSFSGHPQFSSTTTAANLQDSKYDAASQTYNQSGIQTDPFRFHRHYTGYNADYPVALDDNPQFSFAGGQKEVKLPKDTGIIKTAAQGSNTAYASSGNTWDANKSYRIQVDENSTSGRISAVERQNSNGTWSSVAETSAPPIYKMEFAPDGTLKVYKKQNGTFGSSTTWVQQGAAVDTTTQPGVTLHVDGFVLVKGTVQGRVTLGSTYDIHSIDDLVYKDKTVDVMGIVAERNFIVQSPKSTTKDRTLDASILTLTGSFTVDEYSSGSPRGDLHIYGGLIQKNRGAVGTFTTRGGVPVSVTGYRKDYQYDNKLLMKPPLNFPTTGTVILNSIIDQGAAGSL
ncbi:MAG: DUF4900 domain-containing protein [Armatimonadetes bacterium]|nr:DUF4900 domain-containing protein [Armatimonadota bacterium]